MSSPFTTSQSRSLLERHQSLLTGGYVSHKSLPEMAEKGYPVFVDRAKGARFWDVDGNEYLDYLMGYGPIVLGYDDPAICEAVRQQMAIGTIFTTAYRKELDVAEQLIELIPSAEMVGFFIGGSAATSGAVRLSRAYTNREKVIKSGYHGWHDWTRPEDPGVPQAVSDLTLVVPYGDLHALESIFKANDNQIACLILETVQDTGPPEGYLQACVDLANTHGALCVFDETKVGFRIAFGGAGEHFGVTPDISTFGKACCNGYPGTFIS